MARSRVSSVATTGLEVLALALFAAGLVLAFGAAAGLAFVGGGVCLGASYLLTRR